MAREIERDEKGYYCGEWDGKQVRYPSVTTALGMLTDFSKVRPDVLERNAKFGTALHDLVDLYERGKLDREALDPRWEKMLVAWEKCKSSHKILVHKTEEAIVSNKYQFAGRLDLVGLVRGTNSVIEIKSRVYNPTTEPLQTAAYLQAYNESFPKEKAFRRFFCGIYLDGTYRFFEIKRHPGQPDHLHMFLSALALYKWKGVSKI